MKHTFLKSIFLIAYLSLLCVPHISGKTPNPCDTYSTTSTTSCDSYTWSCNGSPVGGACAASHTPGVVVDGFDLIVRKFIGTNDAETAAAAVVTSTNASLTYQIVVTNV